MSKTILTGMVILFLILCIGGCITTSYYSQGRRSMKYEDWETAIEYFELARTKNPEDPRIRRELGIVYYQKDDLNQAIPHLLEAFIMDSTDGRTLFYLGTAYEVIRDYRHAIDIYNRYVNISPFDDVKISVEARLVRLTRLQMEEDAKQALAGEEEIDVASIPEGTIAVLYFKNIGKKRDLNPIQKGLADMLITDLSKVNSLKLVERIRMQKLVEEMGLGMSGLVDEKTAPRVGRLLGTSMVVKGTFNNLSKNRLRINGGVVQAKKQKSLGTKRVTGSLEQLFKLEKDLAFGLVESMGIKLSQAERDAISIVPTENMLAFLAYCRGLDNEDQGLFREASQEYSKALELDPNFTAAHEKQSDAEKVISAQSDVGALVKSYAQKPMESEVVEEQEVAIAESVEEEPVMEEVQEEEMTEETPSSEEEPEMVEESEMAEDSAPSTGEPEEIEMAEAPSPPESEESPFLDEMPAYNPAVDQMMHLGGVIDQTFLPGIDSREPAQEENQTSFGNTANFEIRAQLPDVR